MILTNVKVDLYLSFFLIVFLNSFRLCPVFWFIWFLPTKSLERENQAQPKIKLPTSIFFQLTSSSFFFQSHRFGIRVFPLVNNFHFNTKDIFAQRFVREWTPCHIFRGILSQPEINAIHIRKFKYKSLSHHIHIIVVESILLRLEANKFRRYKKI